MQIIQTHHIFLLADRDLGVLTGDGHGKIVGRIKDMVIRGGENIYPREIEELLHTHPDIQEAQVGVSKSHDSMVSCNALLIRMTGDWRAGRSSW